VPYPNKKTKILKIKELFKFKSTTRQKSLTKTLQINFFATIEKLLQLIFLQQLNAIFGSTPTPQ
jgi:hypothetical protein